MESSQKPQIHAVFAVFSKNALIQNRLRIILKGVLKKPLWSFASDFVIIYLAHFMADKHEGI